MYQVDEKLEMFMDKELWTKHIQKGISKGIKREVLKECCDPHFRIAIASAMLNDEYRIAPPHIAEIPKDNGKVREVYVNEPLDRICLSIINDVYYSLYKNKIHPCCISYQPGIGVGQKVRELSEKITTGGICGVKIDFTKYFDSLNKKSLYKMLDELSSGSCIDHVVQEYYRDDHIITKDGKYKEHYKSIAQGCALGGLLANIALYEIDEHISKMDVVYYRYSDDAVIIGKDWKAAYKFLTDRITDFGVSVNPKKVEFIRSDSWFTFLGFSIKGSLISFSKNKVSKFEHEIKMRTVHNNKVKKDACTMPETRQAIKRILQFIYSPGRHDNYSWGEYIFSTVNCEEDIIKFDEFVKDCLRAMQTNRREIGGLGYQATLRNGIVDRGKGRHVTSNSERTDPLDSLGYVSMNHMYKLYRTNKEVYRAYLRAMEV